MTWPILDEEHNAAIEEILSTDSDRIAAVVGGALLERAIHRTLIERLRDDKDIAKKLLKIGGAIGNSGAQVDLLYLLHAFEQPAHIAMEALLKIRNFFAHHVTATFGAPKDDLIKHLNKLALHEGLTFYPHPILKQTSNSPIEPMPTNRDKFLVNLKISLGILMRDRMSHHTWSNAMFTESEQDAAYGEWVERKYREGFSREWLLGRTRTT